MRLRLVALAILAVLAAAPAAGARAHAHGKERRIDTPRAERAIAWYRAHLGATAWEGLCETAVERAFGVRYRYADARANWESDRGVWHLDWRRAPRGALVFWSTSAHGHVAISLGDGTALTTSGHGGRITRVRLTWFSHPLGWKRADWA